MAKYFGKRLVIGLITLFALATITFFLMHAIPGSPFAGETSKLPANVKEKLVEQYGLDKPVTEQYVRYLQNAVKGDFGTSYCTCSSNFTRKNFRFFKASVGK